MNKTELAAEMAKKSGLSRKDAEKALAAFTETVKEALQNGEKVQLIGFGTFEVSERAEREGHNPSNGDKIIIAACKVPKFKAGKALKDAINAEI
ncbi:MAG: HU family DNA-binding protein [Lachnospiraceae bacterium]|nr:HU family DNA-binding protein [Lachnospiraceae bacterium]